MADSVELEPVEIRMEGVFDVPAAQAVVRVLERTEPARRVRVDLVRVREFHDFAVAVFAQGIARRGGAVTVRGLGEHQLRTLSYLGLGGAGAAGASAS